MLYDEAFKIGAKCDGYVRCTYAQLMSSELGALFSLQSAYTRINKGRVELENIGAFDHTQNTDANAVVLDVPVVIADTYVPNERLVPVRLTEDAATMIAAKVARRIKKTDPTDERRKLLEGLRNYKKYVFYVKKVAIDWVPTDIQNATIIDENGKPILLSDYTKAAKEQLDRAKAILAAAGVLTII